MKRKHVLIVGGLFVLFLILALAMSALYEDYRSEHQIGAVRFMSCGPLGEGEPVYEFDILAQQVGKKWKTVIFVFPKKVRKSIATRSDTRYSNRIFDEPTYYLIVHGHEHKLEMDHVYLTNMRDVIADVPMTEVFSQPFDPDKPFEGYQDELLAFLQKQQVEGRAVTP